MIKPGRYRYYRGGVYVVLFTAKFADDEKPYVVYMNVEHGSYHVRSLKEFTSKVMEDSEEGGVPMFKPLDNK